MQTREQALIDLDLQHIWHPCSQMKDHEKFPPFAMTKAYGCHLELMNGSTMIDAIASWWCKSLGHAHPRLKQALLQQIEKFEHVILANTTNATIAKLSQQLAQLLPPLNKICYASDGSCAVEIALKMSLQAREILGEKKRNQFLTLSNSYHGETIGALSVSDIALYRDTFKSILFSTQVIEPLPYIHSVNDPLWNDCTAYWRVIEPQLNQYADTATAIIIEPILQAAGGMRIYSQHFLQKLRHWCDKNNVHLIADEIMTGLGRTGKMLACQNANIIPDFLCLGKGLTSGYLPLSVMLTQEKIYQLFYADYSQGKSFLHSHTHSGNALAASIASAVLTIFSEENICAQAEQLGVHMLQAMREIADESKKITHVRGIGAMVAADLICHDPSRRLGYEVCQIAMRKGALLRPLGNTIYWVPPLIMDKETLDQLKAITLYAISDVE